MAAVTLPGSSGSRSTTICSTGRPPMPPRALISDTAKAEPPIISCPSAATWPHCGKAEPIRYGRRGSARRWAGEGARAWPLTTACTRPTGSARNAPPPSGGGSRSRPSSTASAATPARVDCPSLARIRSACFADRAPARAQQRADLVVREPAHDQRDHVQLANGQPVGQRRAGQLEMGRRPPVLGRGLQPQRVEVAVTAPQARQPLLAALHERLREPGQLRLGCEQPQAPGALELARLAVSIDNCSTVDQGNSALEETGLW